MKIVVLCSQQNSKTSNYGCGVQNLFSKFCMKCCGLSNIDCFYFAFKIETKLKIRTAFAYYRLLILNK